VKSMELESARAKAHAGVDAIFDALTEVIELCDKTRLPATKSRPSTSPIGDGFDLESAVKQALARNSRKPPSKLETVIDDAKRRVIIVVRQRTADADWSSTSATLQANLRLTRQQVAGVVAATRRSR